MRRRPACSRKSTYFAQLFTGLKRFIKGNEQFTCSYAAEQSDFVRFNHGRIRQAGHVDQAYMTLRLIDEQFDGRRQASITMTLSGTASGDLAHCQRALVWLRGIIRELPVDPYLIVESEGFTSRNVRVGLLPSGMDMAAAACELGAGHDLVGFLATGPVQRGFASSFGHHNSHEVANFNFEWSLYFEGDKAAKTTYAGFDWQPEALRGKLIRAANDLAVLSRPVRTLTPGSYRVYLAPMAMHEIVGRMCWNGFSAKARATRTSPLQKLYDGQIALSPAVSISEHTASGLMPVVQSDGFRRPDHVNLIAGGKPASLLASPRTAHEYGLV